MKRYGIRSFLGVLAFLGVLSFGLMLAGLPAHAATPGFTFSATNVAMPSSGDGSIPFILTSVDGYASSIVVRCGSVNAPTGAKIPSCGAGPVEAIALSANQTVHGNIPLIPYGYAVPLTTSALLLGFGLRRRRMRWPRLGLLLVGAVVALGGVVACGGNSGMTPGTYAYTITATDIHANTSASTTAEVTVQ